MDRSAIENPGNLGCDITLRVHARIEIGRSQSFPILPRFTSVADTTLVTYLYYEDISSPLEHLYFFPIQLSFSFHTNVPGISNRKLQLFYTEIKIYHEYIAL